jgi:hypothetical protein
MPNYKFPFKDIEWVENDVSQSIVHELAFPFLINVDVLDKQWAHLKVEGAEDAKKLLKNFSERKYKMTLLANSFVRSHVNNSTGLTRREELDTDVKTAWTAKGIKFTNTPLSGPGSTTDCMQIPSDVELNEMSLSSAVNMITGGSRSAAEYCYFTVDPTNSLNDVKIRQFVNGTTISDVEQIHNEGKKFFTDKESSINLESENNNQNKIYADILLRNKNIVLEGPPGTGKTFAIKGIVDQLKPNFDIGGEGKGKFAITMHPATNYEDFIEGLRPALKSDGDDGKSSFLYKPGVFVQRVRDAIKNPHQQHVVLLDELNRSNVPRVLGDLLTTLEASKRTPSIIPKWHTETRPRPTRSQVIIMAKTKPPTGSTKGFSYTTYFGESDRIVKIVGTTNKADYKHKEFEHSINHVNRYIKLGCFKNPDMLHEINIEGDDTEAIILIQIDEVYYPMKKNSDFANYLIQDIKTELPGKIIVIDKNGDEKIYPCAGLKKNNHNPGRHTFYHEITLLLPSPEGAKNDVDCCESDSESEYYWCSKCDDLWKKEWGSHHRTEVTLSGSKKKLHIPDNLLVVATMNTTDRSVAPLDAALRRRFVFLRVDPLPQIPKKDKKGLIGKKSNIFKETEELWIELNEKLEQTLGHDAKIGHSYLFDLIKELKKEESDENCDELCKQFWKYSVLPQVADLLDATGRSNAIWNKINLVEKFNRIGLRLNTGPEDFKSFARTIVVEVPVNEPSMDKNQNNGEPETT